MDTALVKWPGVAVGISHRQLAIKANKCVQSAPPNWNIGYAPRPWPNDDVWSWWPLAPVSGYMELRTNEPLTNIAVGAMAACSASFVTHPIEVAKLRIQLQGELLPVIADRSARARPVYRNTLQSIYTIYRYDGVLAIYRGASHKPRLPAAGQCALFGGVSGAIGAFVSSPLFLLKTHQQLHSSTAAIAVGYQRGYGSAHAELVNIYRTQGVWRGLWRATSCNVLRLSTGSALQLSTFSGFKGVLDTAAYTYSSMRDCIVKIRQTEGLRGLWRGIGGAFFYTMTSSVITLVSWEEIKKEVDEDRQESVHDITDYGIN
ncbi:hypothetical protein MRX96_012327 [Rhipicephalus microplus]